MVASNDWQISQLGYVTTLYTLPRQLYLLLVPTTQTGNNVSNVLERALNKYKGYNDDYQKPSRKRTSKKKSKKEDKDDYL